MAGISSRRNAMESSDARRALAPAAAALTPTHQDPPAPSEAQPARPLTHGTLRSAYCDLLGRPPFEAERSEWLGKARHELCDRWIGTEPFWAHWLEEQLYYFFLID